jgi:hypothetical protein
MLFSSAERMSSMATARREQAVCFWMTRQWLGPLGLTPGVGHCLSSAYQRTSWFGTKPTTMGRCLSTSLLSINTVIWVSKQVKLPLQQAVEACSVVRCWESHIIYTVGSQMVVTLAALHAGHTLLPINIIFLLLVLICVRGWVNPRAWCGWKDYVHWKKITMISSGQKPWTFRLVA